jgi:N-acetylglucosaminyldiphosphoundecaprenol N-acetyl-beta-D-mannosaminyltransferase
VPLLLTLVLVALNLSRWRRTTDQGLRLDLSGLLILLSLIVSADIGVPRGEAPPAFGILVIGGFLVWIWTTVVDRRNWRLLAAVPGLLLGALVASYGGVAISTVKLPFSVHFVALGWGGPLATALWLTVCGMVFGWNAGLLEIPLGVGGLAALTVLAVGRLQPAMVGPDARFLALMLGVTALMLVPFARYLSRHAARAGAVTVGFLLGGLSLLGALKHTAFLVALLPLLIIAVPIFSVGYAYAADRRHGGRALAVGERRRNLDMLLLAQGYSRRQVVGLLLAGTAYVCLLGLGLVGLIQVSFVIKLLLLVVALVLGGVVFYVVLRLLPRGAAEGAPPEAVVQLLGVRVNALGWEAVLAAVEGFLREDHPHMIVTSDSSTLVRAQEDDELRAIMNEADLVTADGAGVVLAARILNLPLTERVSGCDLVMRLCEAAARQGRSVYFLGGEPGVAAEAAAVLQGQIPGLEVAGCRHGYFTPEEDPEIVAEIAAARPGVLLVALGIPRQEKWIKRHLEALGVPVCIGIGGSLDVISGRKQRAPVWMQRGGLEWLYRTAKEPWRLPRLKALPTIVWMSFRELLRR